MDGVRACGILTLVVADKGMANIFRIAIIFNSYHYCLINLRL
jgi:hypothetical protein